MAQALKRRKSLRSTAAVSAKKKVKPSFIESLFNDYFLTPKISIAITHLNFLFVYIFLLLIVSDFTFGYWTILIYLAPVYILYNWRKGLIEKERMLTAHTIPFFADALANGLSAGMTLDQAFEQSSYYLKGRIKTEFETLMTKYNLGINLGELLRDLDLKFPNTGLSYLISLLEEYHELGVGISPLLKKIADALTIKEESEEKIRTVLASGSSYARLSIGLFSLIFLGMTFLLRDQVAKLLSPELKPILIILIVWAVVGMFIMSRITGMEFAKNFALKDYTKHFLMEKKFTVDELMDYSGMDWTPLKKMIFKYIPLMGGFAFMLIFSLYTSNLITLIVSYGIGAFISWKGSHYVLKGAVEDQLIKTIESFPEMLRVFIIGINAGLNTSKALLFAADAVKKTAPQLLTKELSRVKFAMECGEKHSRTWQQFSEKLPFQTIIDFCEIMVLAPSHGESIVHEIIQMTNSYQVKKLNLVEKKAVALSQVVIPLIVMAFFPLFLFTLFAPLILQISNTIK